MRIGFDAKRLFNNFTGLGNYSRSVIDHLVQEFPEHEYYLYTPKVRLNDVTAPYLSKECCRTILPQGFVKGGYWRTFRLAREMKRDGIELFHGLSNEVPAYMFHSGIPSVVTIHDVAFRTFPKRYYWQDRKIYDAKWKYACEHADGVIAVNEMAKRELMEYFNLPEHKVDILYEAVDDRYYQPIAKTECSPFMLYAGSKYSYKDLMNILDAMAILPKDLQIPLVVMSGRIYKNIVMQYARRVGLSHLLIWNDHPTEEEKHQLYTNAELFLFPALHEKDCLPVIEAALSGCPVITNSSDFLPGLGDSYALHADHNDISGLKEQLENVLSNAEFRRHLSICGKEYATKTFHPIKLAHQLMDIYKKFG